MQIESLYEMSTELFKRFVAISIIAKMQETTFNLSVFGEDKK